ncbi:MAG: response regulator, partial [Phaeodactylibacter sp.]|nr:response regulator [Phaeodactylibacter sp.]
RFYQADGQEHNRKGSGIGLSLCKELVEWMDGSIEVESTLGQGSRFRVELPRINAVPQQTEDLSTNRGLEIRPLPEGSKTPIADSSRQILLVEDSADLRHYTQGILQANFAVESVADGQAAWEVLEVGAQRNLLPQLVISDIMMPRMDGFELLKKLREDDRFRHIPIIMLTARTEDHDKLNALRAGVDDYIHKPFLEGELIARVQHLIRHYRGRKSETIRPDLKRDLSGVDLHWLEKVESLTMEHLSKAYFSVSFLTDQLAMSERQFQRRIKQITGLSPNRYVREIRLVKARELLVSGKVETVAEVAHAVGFDTPAYFSSLFQERFGRKPIDFL